MEMELVSGSHIPDGLLAAMTLLSEKPRQGVPSCNLAPIQGITEANCTVAIGLRFRCSEIVSGTVVAPSSCPVTGNAPIPVSYQAAGQAVANSLTSNDLLQKAVGYIQNVSNLLSFHNQGANDAQNYSNATTNLTPYANYVFGVYMAAAGYSLPQTLQGANLYASLPWKYRGQPPSFFDKGFQYTPAANVKNITNGFNNQRGGNLCPVKH